MLKKRCPFLLGAILLLTLPVTTRLVAQPEKVPEVGASNSLVGDTWAFQFQIDESFRITSFQGTMLSLKRQFSPSSALRAGVSISLNSGDGSSDQGYSIVDTLQYYNSSAASATSNTFLISVQYLLYPNPTDEINLFFGGGPQALLNHSSSDEVNPSASNASRSTSSETNSTYFGISGLAGVEWFATRSLSFHGEYGVVVQRYWNDRVSEIRETTSLGTTSIQSSSSTGDGWRITASSVRIGLSVYFQ
jgi:hypothetical protein